MRGQLCSLHLEEAFFKIIFESFLNFGINQLCSIHLEEAFLEFLQSRNEVINVIMMMMVMTMMLIIIIMMRMRMMRMMMRILVVTSSSSFLFFSLQANVFSGDICGFFFILHCYIYIYFIASLFQLNLSRL